MSKYLVLNTLFVSKKNGEKAFFSAFSENVNIICGKNTSGKSTVFQSILYTLGINDVQEKLEEIIAEDVFFRLDFTISDETSDDKYIFIRDNEFLLVFNNNRVLRFNGISADNSVEHIKLKEYIHSILGCNFRLEDKNGFVLSPIEAIFLPYYVSQDFGWIYIRKSFTNLEFYRSFKEDYLDFYLNIENLIDRQEKNEFEKKIFELKQKIEIYKKVKESNEIQSAKTNDIKDPEYIQEYIRELNKENSEILEDEKKLLLYYNEFEFWRERKSVLSKIARNHKKQFVESNRCPVCKQTLPENIESIYIYYQEANDTEREMELSKKSIKEIQSKINQLEKRINKNRYSAKKREEILEARKIDYLSTSEWIEEKAYIKLNESVSMNIGDITIELDDMQKEYKEKYGDKDINTSRLIKEKEFKDIFILKLHKLGITRFDNTKYLNLYSINGFPAQGVELHKMILAYYLSFYELIKKTNYAHTTPLLLDAIFKEDIDDENRLLLIKLLANSIASQNQLIISIAESENTKYTAEYFNTTYFSDSAKIIRIGESKLERSFLIANHEDYKGIYDETYKYIEEN